MICLDVQDRTRDNSWFQIYSMQMYYTEMSSSERGNLGKMFKLP